MEQPQRKQNPLETEPIGRLIRRYSIPTALTLMVNYLYNIVDQIFVGQGVGVTGMAATNVAFPLTIVTIALALMIGDGCAANMSLCLGRRQQEEADRTASHTVTLLVAAGVFLAVAGSLFARQIVLLFGATETAFQASLDYTRIIVWGLPFLLFSSALTAIIRADGNPKYTMKCMILGAVINTVLDPVFIFGLHMGVVGAAIATVIGQVAAGGLCLVYLRRLQSVRIRRAWLRPTAALTGRIFKLGIPSFLTQIMTAAVQVTMNNLMTRYGAQTAYGGDVALSVYGMVMKVYQIAHAMFVGVSSATQPINGYNFGAKRYDRVRAYGGYHRAGGVRGLVRGLSALPPGHWHIVCLRGPGVPGRLPAHLPGLHAGLFPLWDSHGHFLLFPGDWETRAGSGHSLGPAGCGADSPGAAVVPGLWFQWGAAGSPHRRCGLLSPLPGAGTAGVPALEKTGLALVSRRRWNQTAHRAVQLGQRGVRLFYGEPGLPQGRSCFRNT